MKKTIVAALGIAFAFSAVAASAATTYTRDLTIGSTGADVVSLQDTLVAKGFLVIPANVSKGYFGSLTKTALMNYQKSVGIAPALGYFGPLTRAHFNNLGSTPAGDDNGDDDEDSELQGGEGDIKDFDILGNPSNTDLDEGETDEVLGFEFEAEDSDIRLERVEILASSTNSGSQSDDPWDYIESARLMADGEELAEVTDLDDEDSWDEESTDDTWTFRFEDVNFVVEEDETAKFYVEFTSVDNLDSDDEDAEFQISINDDGLRVVDGEGIDIEEGDSTDTAEVTFAGEVNGDLESNIDEDDNEDRIVFVDEDSETEGVEIMRFTIESNEGDNTIDQLQVALATTTATNTTLAEVISSLRLEVDGDEISSESVPSGTGTSTVTFEDLEDDFVVGEDEEVEVVVYADIEAQEGNYGEGYEFNATVRGAGIDAEDANGDDVTISENVTGGDIELRVDGVTFEFVSASETRTNGSVSGDADSVEFKITFEVTAEGDDIYVDGDAFAASTATSGTDGVAWSTSTDSSTGTSSLTAIVTAADGYKSSDSSASGNKYFKVSDGNSRTFTLTVSIPAGADNTAAGVVINGFKWNTTAQDVMSNAYTVDLEDFRTDVVTGLYIR
jgi:hypothetical protein